MGTSGPLLVENSTLSTERVLYEDTWPNDTWPNDAENLLKELNSQQVRQLAPVISYLILIIILGLMGNSVTCYIYKTKMKKTTANGFIVWLAVLDLCSCLFGIPFEICDIVLEYLFNQPVVCKIFRCTIYFTLITSLATLLIIAVDRYYIICKPLKQSPTRNSRRLIVGSAMIGIILASPVPYFYGTVEIQTPLPEIVAYSCAIHPTLRTSVFAIVYFGFLLFANIVSMLSLIILYICVGIQVRRRSRMTIGSRRSDNANNINDRNSGIRRGINVFRATILCVAITVAFIVSFSPTLVLHTILVANGGFEDELSDSSFVALNFFLRSYFLTNAINPIIYGFLIPAFRTESMLMLKRLKPSCESHPNANR